MLQEVFRIPGLDIPIFGYGLMMVIGFLCGVQLAKYLARRCGLDPEVFVNAALIALVAGVVGARISHVLENFSDYTRADRTLVENLWAMVNIRSGGLTFYGGLILAFPIVIWYGIRKNVPIPRGMDIVAPAITMGLAFGRIGCFLNGCCYGAECQLPWAVAFPYYSSAYVEQYDRGEIAPPKELLVADGRTQPDPLGRIPKPRLVTPQELRQGYAMRTLNHPFGGGQRERVELDPSAKQIAAQQHALRLHPAQLYSAFTSFLITAILVAFFTMNPAPGRVMALMLMLEGVTRFLLEMVRAEPAVVGRMSISMIIAVFVVVGGVIMWFVFVERRRDGVPAELAAA
jgi:phosphatidylglycerol---prolipoprotein diacylglyceryl transferase